MNRITYGPFSVRMDLLAGALAGLIGAPLLIGFGGSMTRIHCERGATLSCAMWTWFFKLDTQRFTPVSVRTTFARRIYKNHPSDYGRIVITDDRGREHSSIEVSYSESNQRVTELQAFLRSSRAGDIAFTLHESWGVLGLGVFSGFLFIILCPVAMRGAGRIHLQFAEDSRELIARRSFWGIPLSKRHIDIANAKAVNIEWKSISVPMSRPSVPTETAARICILTSRGNQALSTFARGRSIHLSMAKDLRKWLGLPPMEDVLPPRAPGFDWSSPMGRFSACWAGISVGALTGMTLGCFGALTLGGMRMSSGAGGPWFVGGAILGIAGGIATALYLTSRTRLER